MDVFLEPCEVRNFGVYIGVVLGKLPYRDVVVGNPLDEVVKIDIPIYSEQMVDAMRELGIIVRPVKDGESLVDAIGVVKRAVQAKSRREG